MTALEIVRRPRPHRSIKLNLRRPADVGRWEWFWGNDVFLGAVPLVKTQLALIVSALVVAIVR